MIDCTKFKRDDISDSENVSLKVTIIGKFSIINVFEHKEK
jgi:hypothetical protein